MEREARQTQMLKGVLDLCLLALMEERPRYGYEIASLLRQAGLLGGSEGSIYPLLARLENGGLLTATYQASPTGPTRKYYELTPRGREVLAAGRREWADFAGAVNRLLGGGDRDRLVKEARTHGQ